MEEFNQVDTVHDLNCEMQFSNLGLPVAIAHIIFWFPVNHACRLDEFNINESAIANILEIHTSISSSLFLQIVQWNINPTWWC